MINSSSKKIKRWRDSQNKQLRFLYFLLLRVKRVSYLITRAEFRSRFINKFRFSNNYFQEATYSEIDRYPFLFNLCKTYFSNRDLPRKILSFGCSTGEEVFSLHQYFPSARIIGVDINSWCIKKGKEKYKQFLFLHSQSKEFNEIKEFDAIFCLAVLQHTQNRTQEKIIKATRFTFKQFEEALIALDKKLKPMGLLVIDHTDFGFNETRIARKYQPFNVKGNKTTRKERRMFDKYNNKIADQFSGYRIWIKQYSDNN